MSFKSTPISFRLGEEEATFLAGFKIEGAKTVSEKIRMLIKKAREEETIEVGYAVNVKKMNDQFEAPMERLRLKEMEINTQSELVHNYSQWMIESCAYFQSELEQGKELNLPKLEEGLGTRSFQFLERLMRMGVTDRSNCYNDQIINEKLGGILEISKVLNNKKGE
jgi:hypothetical protein